jgi:hypothetical protein
MFPAMIIVPTLQIAWTLFSILSGMLYFQEYRGLTPLDASMFALGVTVRGLGEVEGRGELCKFVGLSNWVCCSLKGFHASQPPCATSD